MTLIKSSSSVQETAKLASSIVKMSKDAEAVQNHDLPREFLSLRGFMAR